MVKDGEQSPIAAAVEPDVELGRLGGGGKRLGEESSKNEEEEGSQRFSDAEDRSWHSRQNSATLEDFTSTSAPVLPCAVAGEGQGDGAVGRGRKSCVSECSLDDIDLEAGPAEITKASPDKDEMNCRICHLGLESAAAESGAGIVLGCSCKDDLSCAHKQCAETWFKIRGNKRPLYTPAPEGLLNFGQFSPMHMYNFQPPPMHHHDQGNQRTEDLHFVGTSPHDSFSTPPPPPHPKAASRSAPAKEKPTTSKRKRKVINVDDDEPNERTAQRLSYTAEEHVRLANAWLECSGDPIAGNTKKRIGAFHGEWTAVIGVYHSGHSTVDLETMALEKYEANYRHTFQHLTMWKKLKDDGKWLACYRKMKAKEGTNLPSNVINLENEQRPSAGRDKSKAERAGKGKGREVSQELGEKLDKFIQVNNQSMEERQKVMETQVFLSNRQFETAKLTNKTKMLDVYQNLLLADTSRMDADAKAGRAKALKNMESLLFPEGDSGGQGE